MPEFKTSIKNRSDINLSDTWLWLVMQSEVVVENVSIHFQLAEGLDVFVPDVDLKLSKDSKSNYLTGFVTLPQESPTTFRFVLRLRHRTLDYSRFNADLYLTSPRVSLHSWLKNPWLKSHMPAFVSDKGTVSFEAWARWRKGNLILLQSLVDSKDLEVNLPHHSQPIAVDQLKGNFAWQKY